MSEPDDQAAQPAGQTEQPTTLPSGAPTQETDLPVAAPVPSGVPTGFAGDNVLASMEAAGASQEQLDAARGNLAGQGLVGPPPDPNAAGQQAAPDAEQS